MHDTRLRDRIAAVVAERVEVVPYDLKWPRLFEEEKTRLKRTVPESTLLSVEHFGSTAVPGLCAKPVVDVLVGVRSLDTVRQRVAPILEGEGCDYFWRPTFGEDGPPWYAWFIRRDAEGRRTHHIHMVERTPEFSAHWDRILFRDWLRTHSDSAREYGELKMRLAGEFAADRIRYTKEKGAFIAAIMCRAKADA
jgi:GrpB-like predicted nucleotidyltransferase (UPF0157 family)